MAACRRFDILLDLRFRHETDGVRWLERLKGDPATRRIPVLVCSGDHHRLEELYDRLAAWDCSVRVWGNALSLGLQTSASCWRENRFPAGQGDGPSGPVPQPVGRRSPWSPPHPAARHPPLPA